jgi:two-component system, OmpR family, response regulator
VRLLLIEDDAALADGLSHLFGGVGYSVTCASTARQAEALLLAQEFDVVILDLGLPDKDGYAVLRTVRARSDTTPVLILTARDAVDDRVKGLEKGADDYLPKPFDMRELEARVRALIRRRYGRFGGHLTLGRLRLETANRQAFHDDEPIPLPAREYGVLEALVLQAGRVVSKDRIAQRLTLGDEDIADNAIEVYVHRLRKRLESFGLGIRTIRGLGYLLEKPADD